MARRVPIYLKLLGATLPATIIAFAAFAFIAHYVARRALEEELGRRLIAVAEAAALEARNERVDLFQPGDEETRAFRNVRRKLVELRDATGAQRIYLFDRNGTARVDTDETMRIGAHYYELDANRSEIARVFAGSNAASVLFAGKDGRLYKSGFAPLDEEGARVGVGVDGSAALYEQLTGFRRTLLIVALAGIGAMALLSIAFARLITEPLRNLERAARTIGEGDLSAPIASSSSDEIGFLAGTLEQMRVQLSARDERLQMMLAGIAHEVRNPLGGMELFAGLLRDDLKNDPPRLARVQRIERELDHLKTVVNDFLDYARRPRLELGQVETAPLIGEVVQLLATESERAEVLLAIEGDAKATVCGDGPQLRRALLNLGKNAIQACEKKGRVTFRVENGSDVRLSVQDDGKGMSDEERAKIFAPFFTTRAQGTGLGLAFVAEIVRDHGGTIDVQSTLGAGSRFTLRLPRWEDRREDRLV